MTTTARTLALTLALGLGPLFAGCGSADIGEPCDTAGSLDECVDGAVCTNEVGGNVCRLVCDVQEDCPVGYTCNGVSGGSTKSCHLDAI